MDTFQWYDVITPGREWLCLHVRDKVCPQKVRSKGIKLIRLNNISKLFQCRPDLHWWGNPRDGSGGGYWRGPARQLWWVSGHFLWILNCDGWCYIACCRAPALSHEQPPGLHSATTPSMFTPQTLNFAQLSLVTYQSEICTTLQKSNNVNTSFDWNSKSRWIIMAWEIKHYLHKLNSPTFSFTSKWKELNTVKNLTIVEKLYAFITAPSFLNFFGGSK